MPWMIALFGWYIRWFVARHFHRVRVARHTVPRPLPDGPVVVAINHPSWWDPLVAMLIADRLGDRRHLAPIDAGALERYRFFERLGLFGIEPGTAWGLRRLRKIAAEALGQADVAFWITPQGAFTDVRQRPLELQPGVGVVARSLRSGTILPVAVEYAFWNERLPEVLIRFGEPLTVSDGRDRSAREWTALVAERLTQAQDALARQAVARDPAAFDDLLKGRAGVSRLYDLWRRLQAWWRREPYQPEHGGLVKS